MIGPYKSAIFGSGAAIPDGTVTRDPDDSTSSSSSKRGIEIAVGSNYGEFGSIQAKISGNASGFTRAQILKMSDATVIASKDVSDLSAGDIITFDAVLQQGTNYSVILDAEGANYTLGYDGNPSFPYSGSNIDIEIVGGVQGDGTLSANDSSMILGVGGFN